MRPNPREVAHANQLVKQILQKLRKGNDPEEAIVDLHEWLQSGASHPTLSSRDLRTLLKAAPQLTWLLTDNARAASVRSRALHVASELERGNPVRRQILAALVADE